MERPVADRQKSVDKQAAAELLLGKSKHEQAAEALATLKEESEKLRVALSNLRGHLAAGNGRYKRTDDATEGIAERVELLAAGGYKNGGGQQEHNPKP